MPRGYQPVDHPKHPTKIVDVTIGYPDGKPIGFYAIMLGLRKGCAINVHYRIFDVYNIPTKNQTQLRNWIYQLYQEKDDFLEEYYLSGQFSNENERSGNRKMPRQIKHLKWKYYFFNAFYLLSLYSIGYLFSLIFQ